MQLPDYYNFRHKELLEEANRHRLISQYNQRSSKRKSIFTRTLIWWGSLLIKAGLFLQNRFGETVVVEKTRVTG